MRFPALLDEEKVQDLGEDETAETITETTEDAFLGGRLVIKQPQRGSRAGIDALFLAAACPAGSGQRILELGSGSGIVSLAIAARSSGSHVTGIEIDLGLCDLARANARRNGLADRSHFICGDVAGPVRRLFEAGLDPESFDHAVVNPPYLVSGEARLPADKGLRQAHSLGPGDLERWIKCLAAFLRPGGTATIVHRADALGRLLALCVGRFGGLTIYPLFPRAGAAATRILLQGRKGSRAPMSLKPGMTLHVQGHAYTSDAEAVLRDGQSLDVMGGK